MDRRTLLASAIACLAAPPATAQEDKAERRSENLRRIGILAEGSPMRGHSDQGDAFLEGLREHGYVLGQNTALDVRYAHGNVQRFPELAAELVALRVDVIVVGSNAGAEAAQRATKTIPIVMVSTSDPMGLGFASSLARPGGNITGLSSQAVELQSKRLQLLKETVAKISRVAVLWDPTEPGRRTQASEAKAAAPALRMTVQLVEARSSTQLDSAFAAMARARADGVVVVPSVMIFAHRGRIAELAIGSRLPTMCLGRVWVEAGGLISYGPDFTELYRRATHYVGKILNGARPADLPVEQPTKFELVINVKTARALGLTIPPSVLLRADHVVQ